MAKPKEEPVFEIPEFDETEYIKKERERAKAIIIIFLLGLLTGLMAGYLQLLGYTYLSVLIMLAVLVFLGKILRFFKVKVSELNSHKFLNGAMYVLTWMLFWIVFLNPPLHTVSAPQISQADIHVDGHLVSLTQSGVNNYIAPSSLPGGTYGYQFNLSSRYNFTVTSVDYHSTSTSTYSPVSSMSFYASNDTLVFSFLSSPSNEYYFHMIWKGNGETGTVGFTVST